MDWQRGIAQAAEGFAGYRGTDVYPRPTANSRSGSLSSISTTARPCSDGWNHHCVGVDPEARGGAERLPPKELPGRFRSLVCRSHRRYGKGASSLMENGPDGSLGLYPTVMLLTLFVVPHLDGLGLAVAMLVGNALSVALLQWVVMPVLTFLLNPWLHSPREKGKALTMGGLLLILLVLGGLMVLFRQFRG